LRYKIYNVETITIAGGPAELFAPHDKSTFKSGPAELFALKVFELISKAGGPAELFAPCDLSL
jgi:hypothetical protein